MKTTLRLAFICSFCCTQLFSQNYHRMILDSNNWYVSGHLLFLGVVPQGKEATNGIGTPCLGKYEATKDSAVNSKTYKIFKYTAPNSNLCPNFSNDLLKKVLVREDSVLKRIYVIPRDSSTERIAMDFSMNVSDSIYLIYPTGNTNLKSGYYRLDSIVTKTHLIGPRKHFFLSRHNAGIDFNTNKKYHIEWIESIGTVHFPINFMQENQSSNAIQVYTQLHQTCKKQQYGPFVTCKSSNGIKYFQDSCSYKFFVSNPDFDNKVVSSCHFWRLTVLSGLDQANGIKGWNVYPNPFSELLQVQVKKGERGQIHIYNAQGKLLRHSLLNGTSDTKIEVQDLAPGIYNLVLQNDTELKTLKFVKE